MRRTEQPRAIAVALAAGNEARWTALSLLGAAFSALALSLALAPALR